MRFGLLPAATLALSFAANAWADLAFIGANSGVNQESFAFVALSTFAPGTVINFTDSSYGSDGPGESNRFRWTEHFSSGGPLSLTLSTTLTLGQVVIYDTNDNRFERPDGSAFGSTSGVEMGVSEFGDSIIAYQGVVTNAADAPMYCSDTSGVTSYEGALLWGHSEPWQTSGSGLLATSYLPTVPNTPFNFAFESGSDHIWYNGARSFGSVAAMKSALTNPLNWEGSNSAPAMPAGFGGDFVVAVPEASAAAFGTLAGLAAATAALGRRRAGAEAGFEPPRARVAPGP